MAAELRPAVLVERADLHEDLAILRVTPEGWTLPLFEPGQFTNLGLPDSTGAEVPQAPQGLVKRALSIASAPSEREYFEFYVQRIPEGSFTSRLWHLRAGDSVVLDERVYGSFTLAEVPSTSALVLVATGTGLGPYMSMLREYGMRSGHRKRWAHCALVHGVRLVQDLGYRAELEELAREDPDFRYLPTVTREPEGTSWNGLFGRVKAHLEPEAWLRVTGRTLAPADHHVFLCGNPAMIEDVGGMLVERGFAPNRRRTPGQIHTERYW